MTFKLSNDLRKKLKEPYGELFEDLNEFLVDLKEEKTIAVGDETTLNCFEKNFYPQLVIIDGKIKRKPHQQKKRLKNSRYKKIKTYNPAGYLTTDLIKSIKKAVNSNEKTLIDVEGEEDLAVIPSIKFAPINHKILYGQPGKGIVKVSVDEDSKNRVNKLMNKMEMK